MRVRCQNPDEAKYQGYGGRGISVCPEWQESFVVFRDWARANGYRDDLTIERNDVNGDYTPQNCSWIPGPRQARNRRNSFYAEVWGERKLLVDWVEDPRCAVSYYTLWSRLQEYGWPAEAAISTPARKRPAA
jgi:hypothetical protein